MTIVRFAPSPTGRLHIGNIRTALYNWLFALKAGGTFILRYDDTDRERSTEAFADGILEDLNWLGIEPHRIEWQSRRVSEHDAARDRLVADGRFYPAYETPDELDRKRRRARAMGKPPVYDRAALDLTAEQREAFETEGRKPHWRFKLAGRAVQFEDLVRGPQTVNTDSMSDPVLVREDESYLYTLPSVVDDIAFGVTHVIRGEDHVTNSGAQIELFEVLGGTPPVFAHHNLMAGKDGEGLSKRLGSLSVAQMREDGFEPMAVVAMAVLTGTSLDVRPYDNLEALAEVFDFSVTSRSPARFDPDEMRSVNARIVHEMGFAEVAGRLNLDGIAEPEAFWLAVRENVELVRDAEDWRHLVTGPVTPVIADEDRTFIETARGLLPEEPWDGETWRAWTGAIKAETGRKGRGLFMPLRLALTGRSDGPELRSLLPLMGRRACLDRLA